MNVVAIIPALNEEGVIGAVVRGLPPSIGQVIVVDNGSTDATAAVAAEVSAVVVRQQERGYGAACIAGYEAAPDADVFIFLDGDGSDPPEKAELLLKALTSDNADLVLGLRRGNVERGSMYLHQAAGTKGLSALIRLLTGAPIQDLASFKVIRAEVLRSLDLRSRQQGWTAELITKCACRKVRIAQVETGYRRRVGHSKVSGSLKGSMLAAWRLTAAILGVWWAERGRRERNASSAHARGP
jgi:hypothetical protein